MKPWVTASNSSRLLSISNLDWALDTVRKAALDSTGALATAAIQSEQRSVQVWSPVAEQPPAAKQATKHRLQLSAPQESSRKRNDMLHRSSSFPLYSPWKKTLQDLLNRWDKYCMRTKSWPISLQTSPGFDSTIQPADAAHHFPPLTDSFSSNSCKGVS